MFFAIVLIVKCVVDAPSVVPPMYSAPPSSLATFPENVLFHAVIRREMLWIPAPRFAALFEMVLF